MGRFPLQFRPRLLGAGFGFLPATGGSMSSWLLGSFLKCSDQSREAAEAFYSGAWRDGIIARYGNEPRITYFETVALADIASGFAGQLD